MSSSRPPGGGVRASACLVWLTRATPWCLEQNLLSYLEAEAHREGRGRAGQAPSW